MIEIQDPYESFYQVTGNPYQLRAMLRKDVMAVDHLIKVVGMREDVRTIDDWGALAKIVEFYSRQWPEEWAEYIVDMNDIRSTRARKDGYSRDLGTEGTRYLASIPLKMMKMIKIIFPNQQWDREFTDKFVSNIKISRVGEKMDTWFTIPNAPSKRESIEDMIKKIDNKDNGNTRQIVRSSRKRLLGNKNY